MLLPSSPPSTLTAVSPTTVRPAVILPGLGNNTADYRGLASTLKDSYGVPSVVARVSRLDWLRNAAGLIDLNYWRGTLSPRPVLDWYLERVEEAVSEAKLLTAEEGGTGISLIGHSAGGWLARLYMDEFGGASSLHISLLLTLGSPLLPAPKGVPGVIDQTRGLLDYVDKNCSPAVYTPQLRYICIAGRYIQGVRLFGSPETTANGIPISTIITKDEQGVVGSILDKNFDESSPPTPGLRARIIGQGYKQVCGRADVWGDGVVPEMSAHLEGALNISLDGVYHSPVGSEDGTRPWYGSTSVVERWVRHLLS